jgi:hypothetical protein
MLLYRLVEVCWLAPLGWKAVRRLQARPRLQRRSRAPPLLQLLGLLNLNGASVVVVVGRGLPLVRVARRAHQRIRGILNVCSAPHSKGHIRSSV